MKEPLTIFKYLVYWLDTYHKHCHFISSMYHLIRKIIVFLFIALVIGTATNLQASTLTALWTGIEIEVALVMLLSACASLIFVLLMFSKWVKQNVRDTRKWLKFHRFYSKH